MPNINNVPEKSATIPEFFRWINARHNIWCQRAVGTPKPWTDDVIMQQYKFTNVFRQLDTGTIALQKMLDSYASNDLIIFNVIWYRLFNWYEHAGFGFVHNEIERKSLYDYLCDKYACNEKVFTSAHMTTGVAGEDKVDTYIGACDIAWSFKRNIAVLAKHTNSMERVFEYLHTNLYMVGKFVAYEIVCDLRFTKVLENAKDKLIWANMGPGARRGLKRLGMGYENQLDGLASMLVLYTYGAKLLDEHIIDHFAPVFKDPPFELREIEHSLCEFDKYQRVLHGEGRPRQRYQGT